MARARTALSLDERLAAIETMSRAGLIERWQAIYRRPPPKGISQRLLRLAVAYDLQAKALGGLSPAARRMLRQPAPEVGDKAKAHRSKAHRPLNPGSRLVREWHGRTYSVEVIERGYLYEGQRYRSLSEIARLITGARWSGPRFFQP